MFGKISYPKWWVLYLLVVVAVGLFVLEIRIPFSQTEHRITEIGLVLVVFGLIGLWLRVNDVGLRANEWRATQRRAARRVTYTALGQFVTATKADVRSIPAPARVTEVGSVEEDSASPAQADRVALAPFDALSLPLPQPGRYAQGETMGVTSLAMRRS